MTLRDLLHGLTADTIAPVSITGISVHSKQVRPGDLFIAIRGPAQDGHAFIEEAIARGASAILAQSLPVLYRSGIKSLPQVRACPCVVVHDTREALATISARFYDYPSRQLRLLGVTGTNGKTTTTYLLKAILEASMQRVGLLGTIMYQIGQRQVPSTNTTPGPLELERYASQMVEEGLEWCVMEVSSHGLAQGRVAGLEFEGAIFSNLGSDHLDYHKTQEAYASAKRRLFDHLKPAGYAVVNTDDAYGRVLAQTMPHRKVVTYGTERPAQCMARDIFCTWEGLQLMFETPWATFPIMSPVLGRHNVLNMTAAAATLLALGVSPSAIQEGLASIEQIPGRLEKVPNESGIHVLIDYAHTAEALRLVLLSLRELSRGSLILVFGCGGDRDQTKRSVMGKVASLLADVVVLTSDNPRGEDPREIIRQIKSGVTPGGSEIIEIPDREEAIKTALMRARPNDTVLIAGKGHEATQVFRNISVPFLDKEVAERWAWPRHPIVTVAAE